MENVARRLASLGPYLMLEIVMPGGSLMALALFLYRRNGSISRASTPQTPEQ